MSTTEAPREAERLMTICNACRYCEGLCAVFPAMEMRRTFTAGDLTYLANLCHQCGACFPDCQYSPPHQFDVNIPATLARVRNDSYAAYVWPRALAGVFAHNGLLVACLCVASLAAFIVSFVAFADPAALWSDNAGDFYEVMRHNAMVVLFGAGFLYSILAIIVSLRTFWLDSGDGSLGPAAVARAVADSFTLHYLGGGGGGCSSENEQPSNRRRVYHHITFYGFLLCFAATCVATVYHYGFGWRAPYVVLSLPVLLGILGGIGLLIGPVGLFALSQRRDRKLTDPSRRDMTTAFIAMLFLTSFTGFLLLVLRDTAMGLLLAIHLGAVLALFLTLPYGKFVHGIYRFLALVKYAGERRRGTFVE